MSSTLKALCVFVSVQKPTKDKKFDWSSDCNSTVKIRSTAEPQIIKRPKYIIVSDI